MPFASLAFTGFFPASINLYWLTLSAYQLFTTQLMYTKFIRRRFGSASGESQAQRTVRFDSAVIIEEKSTSEEVMNAAEKVKKV